MCFVKMKELNVSGGKLLAGFQLCEVKFLKNSGGLPLCRCVGVAKLLDTINPLLSPLGGGRGDRGLFNTEKTMVLVLHKDLEYIVDKLK